MEFQFSTRNQEPQALEIPYGADFWDRKIIAASLNTAQRSHNQNLPQIHGRPGQVSARCTQIKNHWAANERKGTRT